MSKNVIIIEAVREGYAPDQIRKTATVEELIEVLQEFGDCYGMDSEVYLSHDSGYTYGGIYYDRFNAAGYQDGVLDFDVELEW